MKLKWEYDKKLNVYKATYICLNWQINNTGKYYELWKHEEHIGNFSLLKNAKEVACLLTFG